MPLHCGCSHIKFPYAGRLDHVVEKFKMKWGVPQGFGTVNGYHVPISAPSHLHTDYYNCKEWYSMPIQGFVDVAKLPVFRCVCWMAREYA